MPTQTETIDGATVTVSDDGAPSVRVTIPQPAGRPPISNWDNVPEWGGRAGNLTPDEIAAHPTVQRLLTARNAPA